MKNNNSHTAFASFPILSTKRISLIEITQIHRGDLYRLLNDANVTAFYNMPPLTAEEDAQRYIDWFADRFKSQLGIRWGIALAGSQNIIGTIGYSNFNNLHHAHIVYDLMTGYWNKGYITEVLKEIIDFGFNHLDIITIKAEVMLGNIASEKVLQKLNFENLGVINPWMYPLERQCDVATFSLSKNKYLQQPHQPLEIFSVTI